MSNLEQVKSQIRFGLSQLAEKNGHHEFEHLCRHLTRARICSNIIPSTGPVSSGGDQGSDFETFKTYLKADPGRGTIFLGLISDRSIIFACSTQSKNIPGKVKSDVKKIINSQENIKLIYFFSASGIPISTIHKLKKWAIDTYSVQLEILEAQSISELLADREIFWIASQFLNIPSEIFPLAPDEEKWYVDYREKWGKSTVQNFNISDFFEIKSAVRHAIFTDSVKQDIPFWIEKLESYRHEENQPRWRKATYEICRAKLRGLEILEDEKNNIERFFSDIPQLTEPVELEDTHFLLMYCIGAYGRNLISFKPEQIIEWHNQLIARVEELLKKAKTIGKICLLLELRGFLSIYPKFINRAPPDDCDIDEAINWWMKLTKKVPESPLFPLERFSDRLTDLIRYIKINSEYHLLTHTVDDLLSKRQGEYVVAQKCKDRAIEYHKQGEILIAINELHQSKVKWYSDETLKGSILSILMIANWYYEINLVFAAKYYAFAAAYLSSHSLDPRIIQFFPKSLILASECDYVEGSWIGFLILSGLGLKTHYNYSANAGDFEKNIVLEGVFFNSATLLAITKQFDNKLYLFIKNHISKWNHDVIIDEELPSVLENFSDKDFLDLWNELQENFLGKPYGDISSTREVCWNELGIFWSVYWENGYVENSVVEQFIATLQIMLADLADVDLLLLKSSVEITILIEDVPKPIIKEKASNTSRQWILTLSSTMTDEKGVIDQYETEIISVISYILLECSLLSENVFFNIIEQSFKNGLSMKVFVGQSYTKMYQIYIDKEEYDDLHSFKDEISKTNRNFKIKENSYLPWREGQIPNYSRQKSEEFLRNRYLRVIPPIRSTLKQLSQNQQFQQLIIKLREEGWLDWYILATIHGITMNYIVNQKIKPEMDKNEVNKLYKEYLTEFYKDSDVEIPISEFSEQRIREFQKINMLTCLKTFELECHQLTPDFPSVEHFLRHRCNYWIDDIPHDDLLSYKKY